ncbi:MAG TPA: hydroxymethylbilane synthase [Candidatus Polarisedimenticolaceae bacterium]|nr:hydroxymethylbilane synthase [Candidatus Polarisedimenticolaceae bacterium]
MERLVLGSRGSALALWQARHVAGLLRAAHPGLQIEEVIIKTEGDRMTEQALSVLGGKGVFVKEIEDALLEERIDLAVHSMKDMPTEMPQGLGFAAVPRRHDARDALLTTDGRDLAALPPGAGVATGSPRRRAQLLASRPDLRMTEVRGNVDTRVRKLKEGQFAAMVLALAGIERLGIDVPRNPLPLDLCVPAVGQGALAIETRVDDARTRALVQVLDHGETARAVAAERAFLARLGGGCLAPAAAHARVAGPHLLLEGVVADPDGSRVLRDRESGPVEEAAALGERLAARLLAAGGAAILRDVREAAGPL